MQTNDNESQQHTHFISLIKHELNDIIKNEPLLQDISMETTSSKLNDLKNILSLEYGESMKIFIKINNKYINGMILILVKFNFAFIKIKFI